MPRPTRACARRGSAAPCRGRCGTSSRRSRPTADPLRCADADRARGGRCPCRRAAGRGAREHPDQPRASAAAEPRGRPGGRGRGARRGRGAGGGGATPVASTAHLGYRAGIGVFSTGGLGGVHRGARETWDESADLETLARTGIVVVCAGVKSILDVGATLERLETLGVTVLGYGTDRFAGFYRSDSGHAVPWRVDSPDEVAAVAAARRELGMEGRAIVVSNPLPVA